MLIRSIDNQKEFPEGTTVQACLTGLTISLSVRLPLYPAVVCVS